MLNFRDFLSRNILFGNNGDGGWFYHESFRVTCKTDFIGHLFVTWVQIVILNKGTVPRVQKLFKGCMFEKWISLRDFGHIDFASSCLEKLFNLKPNAEETISKINNTNT